MSVIFSAAITGLGRIAHAVASAREIFPRGGDEYELSQDGETLWDADSEYTFVGFSEDGDFSLSVGKGGVSVGRKLGRVKNEPGYRVWQLCTDGGDYIMVAGSVDTTEVFKRVG